MNSQCSEERDIQGLPPTGFVRQAQLIPHIIPISSSTLWRKVKAGDFPAPVKLSSRVTAWRVEDLREWMAKCG
jgi:predicted DNA-binding transcriptional regulator AlpA